MIGSIAALVMALGLTVAQPSIDDLAWIAGDRVQSGPTSETREVWIGPGACVLLGMGMTRALPGPGGDWEQMRIEVLTDGRLAFIANPKGQPEAVFPLASYENGRAVFENAGHDFPQRVIYWNEGDGVVGARIEGEVEGRPRAMEWIFRPR